LLCFSLYIVVHDSFGINQALFILLHIYINQPSVHSCIRLIHLQSDAVKQPFCVATATARKGDQQRLGRTAAAEFARRQRRAVEQGVFERGVETKQIDKSGTVRFSRYRERYIQRLQGRYQAGTLQLSSHGGKAAQSNRESSSVALKLNKVDKGYKLGLTRYTEIYIYRDMER